MAAVDSSSTNAQVFAAYDDNASYEEDGSVTKAKAFMTAIRIILRRRPQMTLKEQMQISFETLQKELQHAREWLAANPGTSGRRDTRFGNLSNFRDRC